MQRCIRRYICCCICPQKSLVSKMEGRDEDWGIVTDAESHMTNLVGEPAFKSDKSRTSTASRQSPLSTDSDTKFSAVDTIPTQDGWSMFKAPRSSVDGDTGVMEDTEHIHAKETDVLQAEL